MVDSLKETNQNLTSEQHKVLARIVLARIDMQTLEAKNFLTKCGYVTMTKQDYINLNRRVVVGILAGIPLGLLLGYTICRWRGG